MFKDNIGDEDGSGNGMEITPPYSGEGGLKGEDMAPDMRLDVL